MERNDEATNFLLESIRNELVSIIEDKAEKNMDDHKCVTDNLIPRGAAGDATNLHEYVTSHTSGGAATTSRDGFVEAHCSRTIDEDLQNMHVHLKESYELFQTIGDRFENIHFGCLKARIKDLHLNENNKDTIKTIVNDLRNTFDQRYMDNRLSELTKKIGSKFRKLPGEFGDIPELSEFFRACAQLQHGLERLKKERRSVQDLTMRMSQVAEMSFSRMNEMQTKYKEGHNASDAAHDDEIG